MRISGGLVRAAGVALLLVVVAGTATRIRAQQRIGVSVIVTADEAALLDAALAEHNAATRQGEAPLSLEDWLADRLAADVARIVADHAAQTRGTACDTYWAPDQAAARASIRASLGGDPCPPPALERGR